MSFALATADKLAARVVGELSPFCDRIEIAGSVRRRRPFVNDIDIVAMPKAGKLQAFRERCTRNCRVITNGEQNLSVALPLHSSPEVQLDIWIARGETRDLFTTTPGNFGSLLLCRTGSKQHNIWICQRAEALGLRWNPYHGVFGHGKCLASAEEADIFRVLDLDFVPPEKRER